MPVSQETLFDLMQPAKWHGRYFKTLCPFHDDREPSFLVYPDGGQCLALTCQRHVSLQQIYDQISGTARTYVNGHKAAIIRWFESDQLGEVVYSAHELLKQHEGFQHYLTKRGIGRPAIDQAQLGWWEGWYTFPLLDRYKTLTGVMLRASPAMQDTTGLRWLAPPSQGAKLYSPDWARVYRAGRMYVTFGIVDALALWQLGCPVVSPTFLKGFRAEMLDDFRINIRIVPDAGEMKYAREIVSRLGWRGTIIELPYEPGMKDPAEWVINGTKSELLRVLNQ